MPRHSLPSVLALLGLLGLAGPLQAGPLQELHALASESDPQVAAARAEARIQRAESRVLRSLILPQLAASGTMTRARDDTENSNFVGFENQVIYATNYNYGVRLTQPLFNAAAFARYAQLDDQLALAMASASIAEQDLILRVASTYFDWLAAHDNLRFARAELAAIQRALEQAQVRFEVGLAAITDQQEAQARFDLARATELSAAAQLRSRTQALQSLTGMTPTEPARLRDIDLRDPPLPGNPEPWVERALADNLNLLSAQHQAEIARLEARSARGAHYPTLDLVAEHAFSDTSDSQFGRETTTDQVALQLNLPLFTGGATRARHAQARSRFEVASAQAELARRNVEQNARDAYDGVVTGSASVNALQQAVRSAQTARDAVQAGVDVGTRTNVDLLDAERELFRAQRDLARARYDYLLSVLQLEQAVGSLDLDDLQRLDALLES